MSELALGQTVVERFLNDLVHDDQILVGNQRHETWNQSAVALYPMINAGIPVREFLGSDVCDDELGQSVKFGCEIFWGDSQSLPGKSVVSREKYELSGSEHKTLFGRNLRYLASVQTRTNHSSSLELNIHSLGTHP